MLPSLRLCRPLEIVAIRVELSHGVGWMGWDGMGCDASDGWMAGRMTWMKVLEDAEWEERVGIECMNV